MTNTIKFWYNLTVQWTFEPFINWIRKFQYVERKAFAKINTFQCHLVTFRVFSLHSSLSMDPFRWDAHHFQLNVHHLSFSSFFAVSLEIYLRRKIKIDYLFFSSCSSSRSMWRKNISFPIFFSETKWNNVYKRGHYSYLPFSRIFQWMPRHRKFIFKLTNLFTTFHPNKREKNTKMIFHAMQSSWEENLYEKALLFSIIMCSVFRRMMQYFFVILSEYWALLKRKIISKIFGEYFNTCDHCSIEITSTIFQ